MKLKNYMEDAVQYMLDDLLPKHKEICHCSRCRLDITALALNHLPPKYVVTDRGHAFTRVAEMAQQFNADLVVALSKSIKHIARNPRHVV